MTDKTPTYSPASVAAIIAAVNANGGVANMAVAESLVNDAAMVDNDGNKRTARAIIAKMRRMVDTTDGWSYERKATLTKAGKPVTKKLDLVARIAAAAGVTVKSLDGLDKTSKGGLETLAERIEAMAESIADADDEREAA